MPLIVRPDREPTKEEKQKQAARRLQAIYAQMYDQMHRTFNRGMQLVWNNKQGLTPQEVFDAIGTDSDKALQLAAELKSATEKAAEIEGIDPPGLPEIPNEITVNADGTVIVGDPIA